MIRFCFLATINQCNEVKQIIQVYEVASGQAVNLHKSGIFFSSNIPIFQPQHLSSCLGVYQSIDHSRYLGVPSLIGRSKKVIFAFLRDKVWAKIHQWQNKMLSRAGKEILLKSIAQAVPTYCMSVFLLPVSLCDELQRMMNSFWWGTKEGGGRKLHWLRWELMCTSKKEGGMGFRNLHCFNEAMLAKQGWRLMADQSSLLARIYQAKYYPNGTFS